MGEKRDGFNIHDLEELSGFDKRTIAFYIQEGLLPKVGRRGRSTVYPSAFMEKLMFIRAIRDLQDAGILRAVTLAEVQIAMSHLDTDDLPLIRAKGAEAICGLFRDPDWDTRGLHIPVETVVSQPPNESIRTTKTGKLNITEQQSSTPLVDQDFGNASSLSTQELIQKIELAAGKNLGDSGSSRPAAVHSTSVKLGEHIMITVDGLSSSDTHLLVQLVNKLQVQS